MADPQFIPIRLLKNLFDVDKVKYEKINSIKLLRQITGEGLRETKDFFDHVVSPAVLSSGQHGSTAGSQPDIPNDLSLNTSDLGKPMYLVGMTYLQVNKVPVLIVGVSNYNTSYETVYSIDPDGLPIHRYNRRDHGRVTGIHDSPLNLQKVT